MCKYIRYVLIFWIYAGSKGVISAEKIRVGSGYAISSIREALTMAKPGDSIEVGPGVYREGTLRIDKPLTLLGIGKPVLDGEKKHEQISVYAPHVTIRGFVISNSGHSSMTDIAGIKIYQTSHVVIVDNQLENNFFGIYAQGATHCVIRNNRVLGSGTAEQLTGNGIHCWKSDSLEISGNFITGHRDGIYLEFVTHTAVSNNQAADNLRYGLHFMFSHDNRYVENRFEGNGAGVAVMYTKRVTMQRNVFRKNWGDASYGLLLKDITDSHIHENRFEENTTGIFMEGSSRIDISGNLFTGNGWAVKMQASCMDNIFEANNFIRNTFDVATNSTLVLSKFKGNYWDKYEGYDLNRDNVGDVPYRPVSLYSLIVEKYPVAMMFFRSFMVNLLDKTEKVLPGLTPENLKDDTPAMKRLKL